jgi:glycosyltransferase involved in cell wall biosynthesis
MPYISSQFPHPYEIMPNDKFISVCVPTFCRPHYLKKLIDTLEEFADMPYELIVGDDGSPNMAARDEVYAMKDRISFISFNNGMNTGLCTAANTVIGLAHSKYVLFMNDDCFFVKPCLKDVCNILSKRYIGMMTPCNDMGPLHDSNVQNVNGTRMAISNFMGGGSSMAFRKEVWQQVGGWDERSTSGQSDNVFLHKILRAGYWKAIMEGKDSIKVGNFVYGDDYDDTASKMMNGNDCSLPKLFGPGMTEEKRLHMNQMRRVACQYWVDGQRTIPNRETYDDRPNLIAGLNDIPYWSNYFLDIFGGKHSNSIDDIDWEVAKRHHQAQWKDEIFKDFGRV